MLTKIWTIEFKFMQLYQGAGGYPAAVLPRRGPTK